MCVWHCVVTPSPLVARHIRRKVPNSPTRRPQLTLNDARVAGSCVQGLVANCTGGTALSNQKCEFSCRKGYKIKEGATNPIRCSIDGIWGKHPTCTMVRCDGAIIKVPPGADKLLNTSTAKQQTQQEYGSKLVFSCAKGAKGEVTYTCSEARGRTST